MTPSLLNLATEMVEPIAYQLEDKRDVSAFSCTCKKLRELTLHILYEEITCTWKSGPGTAAPMRLVVLLLRSLAENSHLGAHVKRVYSGQFKSKRLDCSVHDLLPAQIMNMEDMKAVQNLVYTAQLPQAREWISALEAGNSNAWVALIVSQLPKVRILRLCFEFHIEFGFLGLLFRHVLLSDQTSRLPAFSNLQCVDLGYDVFPLVQRKQPLDRRRVNNQVLFSFYLTGIRIIEADFFCAPRFSWPTEIPPCATTLTALCLDCYEANEDVLTKILAAAPNLQSLSYHRFSKDDAFNGKTAYLDLARLGHALAQVQKTLESLKLTICFYSNSLDYLECPGKNRWIVNKPFSFQEYEKLEYLELPLVILFGYSETSRFEQRLDTLPLSLRKLILSDTLASLPSYEWRAKACLQRFEDFTSDWKRLTPRLETLGLILWDSADGQWTDDDQQALRALCETAGLECIISK